ncbi:hypothetical protein AVEN_41113-1 [Araneus ventricosus]|uniref:Uncharacterized protein n=1 Tax=Araneus ventricosus TaxID=182803 RepID=A0A4Y2E860_ARAVE|nr:hypothetical protein AVEN_41113-1 [Araneus ventricosus]
MWVSKVKAQCVSWFTDTKSDIQVQRNLLTEYGREPQFVLTIRVGTRHKQGAGCPSVSDIILDKVRHTFAWSSTKSVRIAARVLEMSLSTIHKVSLKRLRLYGYKVQLLQALKYNWSGLWLPSILCPKVSLHLGIGLCLYELCYTLNFFLWCPYFSSNLRHLENRKTLKAFFSHVKNRLLLFSIVLKLLKSKVVMIIYGHPAY